MVKIESNFKGVYGSGERNDETIDNAGRKSERWPNWKAEEVLENKACNWTSLHLEMTVKYW